ncbi:MAG TPA: GGDEF domain-containing protein [Thermoanaerobaculia bacterium]|jgi:diguanylate cyclase (GGDEF)-like protein|nr:GGDEF domain-containing protein [Thermoanaerobaculia bacterium]
MSDERTLDELARLRAEHRQLSDLLSLIQELTSTVVRSESVGDLFSRAAATLFKCVPFDAGSAVMLEQHLDLYVITRAGAQDLVSDQLVTTIRATLESLIPVSFISTEIVVKAQQHTLPARPDAALGEVAAALLEHERRTAGLLLLARREPFDARERQILDIFATQVSMLLDTIRTREKIRNLADTDDLTGIWNRRYFRRQLPQEIERARTFGVPLSLLLFDIDEFKQINDSFGHVLGDVVLSELCGCVRETVRPTDIVARYGGDEFVVILPHTDLGGAQAVAERILRRVRALTIPTDEEGAIQCSVSIGLAEYHRDDAVANDLVRRADERLYTSKRSGKNRYTA